MTVQPRNEMLALMTEYPPLSADAEMKLAIQICAQRELLAKIEADCDASEGWNRKRLAADAELTRLRDIMFYSNVKFILITIKNMSRVDPDDMFQFGALGLMRAIDLYDPSHLVDGKPVRFISYAKYWIKQSVQRGCDRTESTIALPVHVRDTLKTLRKEGIRFAQVHGRQPELTELCEFAGLNYARMQQILGMTQTPTSLDRDAADLTPGFGNVLEAQVQSPDVLDLVIEAEGAGGTLEDKLRTWLAELRVVDAKKAKMLELRFRIGEDLPRDGNEAPDLRTLAEIGELTGLGRNEIIRLIREGMAWIRDTKGAEI